MHGKYRRYITCDIEGIVSLGYSWGIINGKFKGYSDMEATLTSAQGLLVVREA